MKFIPFAVLVQGVFILFSPTDSSEKTTAKTTNPRAIPSLKATTLKTFRVFRAFRGQKIDFDCRSMKKVNCFLKVKWFLSANAEGAEIALEEGSVLVLATED